MGMVLRGLVVLLSLWLLCLAARPARAAEPALVQFTEAADGAGAGWRVHSTRDGIQVERREVPGSRYYEHRAIVEIPVSPEAAAADVWSALRRSDMEAIKHREILREAPDELLLYDQISTPVVSDRDYVISVKRVHDAAKRRWEFRCATVSGVGPPPAAGFVRIPMIRAGWVMEPGERGGTKLTYYSYSEPGGMITALLARGAQADRARADILHMDRRLRKLAR
jgi:hypothetical protein